MFRQNLHTKINPATPPPPPNPRIHPQQPRDLAPRYTNSTARVHLTSAFASLLTCQKLGCFDSYQQEVSISTIAAAAFSVILKSIDSFTKEFHKKDVAYLSSLLRSFIPFYSVSFFQEMVRCPLHQPSRSKNSSILTYFFPSKFNHKNINRSHEPHHQSPCSHLQRTT